MRDHLAHELLHEPAGVHLDPSTLEDILKEPRPALHRPRLLGLPLVGLNVATTCQAVLCPHNGTLATFPPRSVHV